MTLLNMMLDVWNQSGAAQLWTTVSPWLALDYRQLVFVTATPFFIGTAFWEYRRIKNDPAKMNVGEAVRNFMLGAGYQITELLFAGIISFPVFAWVYAHRLATIPLNAFTGILLYILLDFCYYWMHYADHRIRWFWCAHVTHHSSERMNFSTAMRQNATNIFNCAWVFLLPLAWVGFNPVWIGVCFALSLVYQFFIHTTLIDKMHPAVEYVFNTPSHHRVHHGRNKGYIDTNFGGTLIIWDRIFGTFVPERAEEPVIYGITRQVNTTSLLKSWLHEYGDMFADMAKSGPLLQRLRHLWMPPEWRRPISAEQPDMQRAAVK